MSIVAIHAASAAIHDWFEYVRSMHRELRSGIANDTPELKRCNGSGKSHIYVASIGNYRVEGNTPSMAMLTLESQLRTELIAKADEMRKSAARHEEAALRKNGDGA